MFATSLALLASAFRAASAGPRSGSGARRPGAAVAIGPLVGGVLTESVGWESIFFINVPIGVAAVVREPAQGPRDARPAARARSTGSAS